MTRRIVLCALVSLCATDLPADWITVENGVRLRGVGYKKKGKGHEFTLETGQKIFLQPGRVVEHEKSPRGERVEFRGKQVTLRKKIRALQKEAKKREKEMDRDLERWAKEGADAEEAEARFRALSEGQKKRVLTVGVLKGKNREVRTLAAREMARFADANSVKTLAFAAVTDHYRSVRDTSLASLKTINPQPQVTEHFLPFLKDRSPQRRIRAANAISVFPHRRAATALIATLHMSWSGFGRAFNFQGTQRAYVSDYELVSGGTGFSIVEVADPVIQTNTTGVALDVKVRQVELRTRLRAMKRVTGQDFGTDLKKWNQWLHAEKAKAKAEAKVAGARL